MRHPNTPPAKEVDPPKAPTPANPKPEPTSNIREIIKKFNNRIQPEPKPFEPIRSVPVRSIYSFLAWTFLPH